MISLVSFYPKSKKCILRWLLGQFNKWLTWYDTTMQRMERSDLKIMTDASKSQLHNSNQSVMQTGTEEGEVETLLRCEKIPSFGIILFLLSLPQYSIQDCNCSYRCTLLWVSLNTANKKTILSYVYTILFLSCNKRVFKHKDCFQAQRLVPVKPTNQ